jgi:hypothetical protein
VTHIAITWLIAICIYLAVVPPTLLLAFAMLAVASRPMPRQEEAE